MIKTNWIERKSNERVLKEVIREKRSLIMERKIKLIGHLIRHKDFFNNIIKGKIMGPRANYFHDIKEKMGCASYQQLKEAANNRHTWLFRQGVAFRA